MKKGKKRAQRIHIQLQRAGNPVLDVQSLSVSGQAGRNSAVNAGFCSRVPDRRWNLDVQEKSRRMAEAS